MILKVLTHPNPLLRRKHQKVLNFDEELLAFNQNLIDTMHAYHGLGLAAMQVGDTRSMFVVHFPVDPEIEEQYHGVWSVVNPVIQILNHEKIPFDEGCLSVPGLSSEIKRSKGIKMDFQDEKGMKRSLEAQGLLAVCLQHEFDHLQGKLYIDHLSQRIRDRLLKDYKPNQTVDFSQENLEK